MDVTLLDARESIMEMILAQTQPEFERIAGPLIGLISVIGAISVIAAGIWYSLRVKQWEMSLKHSMIERGMSAEEIVAVLGATVKTKESEKAGCGSRGNAAAKNS